VFLGNQFKDEELTIDQHGLYDGQSIFIKEGEPLESNQIRLNFTIYDRKTDTFTPIDGTQKVSSEIPTSDIRKIVFQLPSLSNQNVPDITHLRLRGQHAKKAGPVLFDGVTLKQALPHLSDHQTIAIQILDKPEFLKPQQILIHLQRWYPSKQELQEVGEDLVLPEGSNILALKKQISLHQTEIIEQHLAVARPFSYQLKNKNTLSSLLNWELDPENLVKDGDLILYKDVRDKEVEIEGHRPPEGTNQFNRPLEVGLKIHTVYDAEGRAKFDALLNKDKAESENTDKATQPPTETPKPSTEIPSQPQEKTNV